MLNWSVTSFWFQIHVAEFFFYLICNAFKEPSAWGELSLTWPKLWVYLYKYVYICRKINWPSAGASVLSYLFYMPHLSISCIQFYKPRYIFWSAPIFQFDQIFQQLANKMPFIHRIRCVYNLWLTSSRRHTKSLSGHTGRDQWFFLFT